MTLPAGYQLRPTQIEDAEQATAMLAAVEVFDSGKTDLTTESVLRDWAALNLDEESAVVVDSSGNLVASVDIVNYEYTSVSVYGSVHPEHRGKGIGRELVKWGERWALDRIEHAPEDARVTARHYIRSTNLPGRALLEQAGYQPVRTTYVMEAEFDSEPPPPVWPQGISPRRFREGADERAVWQTVEDSFQDHWGRPRSSFERFLRRVNIETFDPELWFLAGEGDNVVGVSLCETIGEQGWVQTLGVRREWRKQGLGLALLQESFQTFWQRGLRGAWLSVDADSPTGAPRLYTRAGMEVTESYIVHLKELRQGVDYSQFQERE